jgi:hypothetical protein
MLANDKRITDVNIFTTKANMLLCKIAETYAKENNIPERYNFIHKDWLPEVCWEHAINKGLTKCLRYGYENMWKCTITVHMHELTMYKNGVSVILRLNEDCTIDMLYIKDCKDRRRKIYFKDTLGQYEWLLKQYDELTDKGYKEVDKYRLRRLKRFVLNPDNSKENKELYKYTNFMTGTIKSKTYIIYTFTKEKTKIKKQIQKKLKERKLPECMNNLEFVHYTKLKSTDEDYKFKRILLSSHKRLVRKVRYQKSIINPTEKEYYNYVMNIA